ncbi:arsenate reductase family protein [Leptospira sp. GIMC2001]|uniref:arsenate reductase family protein n=1 Tax=Leptospira sp. GIMC2001 TaxID=1513297 RepID=UPI0004A5C3BF|nr:arsenate reductase family protein [Leptospira sp. GIMC2001]AID56192.1 arsenate reductase [Leptospira sp. GIMC2001]WCL49538.1 arsenate reductase family protein [Leptospira sp. GIMC2001]
MKLKFYEYKNCGTCRKASKYLDSKGIVYSSIPIRENPPSQSDLKKMLKYYNGDTKRLFNTSGGDYKELKLKDKLPTMPLDKQIELLSSNGNLVKRPFVLSENFGLIGFKEEEWSKHFK